MDKDFDGLEAFMEAENHSANIELQHQADDILTALSSAGHITFEQESLLRWFCGISRPQPPKEQMSVWSEDESGNPF